MFTSHEDISIKNRKRGSQIEIYDTYYSYKQNDSPAWKGQEMWWLPLRENCKMKHERVNLQLKTQQDTFHSEARLVFLTRTHIWGCLSRADELYFCWGEHRRVWEGFDDFKSWLHHWFDQQSCQAYQLVSASVHQQSWVGCSCAEVFVLPPAEGGRDVQVAGWTLWFPYEIPLIEYDFRGEPNISDICRGVVDTEIYNTNFISPPSLLPVGGVWVSFYYLQ